MNKENKFTKAYFDNAYGSYYHLRNPKYKWDAFLSEIRKHASSGNLFDIGCAYGLFLQEASKNYHCAGVDISFHAVKHAKLTLSKDIELFVGAVGNLHLEASFDLITCFDILEHTRDLDGALDNIWDLLADDGILALTVPVYDGPIGWLVDKLDKDETHNYRCSRDFWLSKVSKRFAVLDCIGIWRYFFFNRFYLNLLSRYSRDITPAILLLARKMVQK